MKLSWRELVLRLRSLCHRSSFLMTLRTLKYLSLILLLSNELKLYDMNKTVKVVLEIIKLVASALLGYFGGNAIM